MVKGKHEFWKLVTKLDGGNRVECNFCSHKFCGTASRIRGHFSGVKSNGIEICTKVPPDVREKAESELSKPPSKKARITASSTIEDDSLSWSKDVQKDVKPEIVRVLDDKKILADKSLVKFLSSWSIPFDVVKDPCFADYIRNVAECGGGYELPTTSMLETIFNSQKSMVDKYVRGVEQSWMKTGCTVMVEAWRSSITITAYAQKGVVFIKSYDDPNNGKSNIDDVKDIVGSAIDDIGSDNVVQVIAKKDTVLFHPVKEMLAYKYPRIYMNPCVSHEIHSLLKNIYNAVGWVKITFDKVVSVIKDVTLDAHILSLVRRYTSISGELLHANSVSGSFASKYPMVCLIVKNKGELDQLVASTEWKIHFDDQNSEMAKPFAEFIHNGDFWSDANDLLKVMEPIVRVLRLVEDDRSTSGYLYETMKSAEKEIEELCSSNNQMNKYQKILELFQDRRNHIVRPMHEVAALLNPDYMHQRNFTYHNSDQMEEIFELFLKTVVSEGEMSKFRTERLLYREQTSELFTKDAWEELKKYHPVTWWEQYGGRLLVLKKHAMRILGQPCKCSLPLKYNAVELVQNIKMKTGNSDTRSMIMNTKRNEMLMERYQGLGERNLFLIPDCSTLPDYYVAHDHKGWGDDDDYVDNCKNSDKADGAGQTGLGVEPLAGYHAIVKSDVSSCKDGGGEKKNISDTFAQLKDFLPGCQLPDVGKISSDVQDLVRWFQVLSLKVDAKKWALNPAEASQQKEGANLRLNSDIVEPKQGMIVEDQSKQKAHNQNMQGATSSLGHLTNLGSSTPELIPTTLQGEFGKSAAASMSHPSGESGYTGQAPQSGGLEHEKHWWLKGVRTNASSPSSGKTLENHGASSTMHACALDQNGTLQSGSTEMGTRVMGEFRAFQGSMPLLNQQHPNQLTTQNGASSTMHACALDQNGTLQSGSTEMGTRVMGEFRTFQGSMSPLNQQHPNQLITQAPQSGGLEHEKHWWLKGVRTNGSSPSSGKTLENHGASSTMHACALDQNGTLQSGSTEMGTRVMGEFRTFQGSMSPLNQQHPNQLTQAPQSGGLEHEKHWWLKGVRTNASSPSSGKTLENHGASSTMHACALDQNGTLQSGSTEMGTRVTGEFRTFQGSMSPLNQQHPNQLASPKGGTPIDSYGHRSEFVDHQGHTRSNDPTSVPEADSVPSQVAPAASTARRFLDGSYSSTTEMQSPTEWLNYDDFWA